MMNEDQVLFELKRIWGLCSQCLETARELEMDDAEDDPFPRLGMVGFSYYNKRENWSKAYSEATREYMGECRDAGHDTSMQQHLVLCYGALMGLYSAKLIDKRLFVYGMATLPGLAYGTGAAGPCF